MSLKRQASNSQPGRPPKNFRFALDVDQQQQPQRESLQTRRWRKRYRHQEALARSSRLSVRNTFVGLDGSTDNSQNIANDNSNTLAYTADQHSAIIQFRQRTGLNPGQLDDASIVRDYLGPFEFHVGRAVEEYVTELENAERLQMIEDFYRGPPANASTRASDAVAEDIRGRPASPHVRADSGEVCQADSSDNTYDDRTNPTITVTQATSPDQDPPEAARCPNYPSHLTVLHNGLWRVVNAVLHPTSQSDVVDAAADTSGECSETQSLELARENRTDLNSPGIRSTARPDRDLTEFEHPVLDDPAQQGGGPNLGSPFHTPPRAPRLSNLTTPDDFPDHAPPGSPSEEPSEPAGPDGADCHDCPTFPGHKHHLCHRLSRPMDRALFAQAHAITVLGRNMDYLVQNMRDLAEDVNDLGGNVGRQMAATRDLRHQWRNFMNVAHTLLNRPGHGQPTRLHNVQNRPGIVQPEAAQNRQAQDGQATQGSAPPQPNRRRPRQASAVDEHEIKREAVANTGEQADRASDDDDAVQIGQAPPQGQGNTNRLRVLADAAAVAADYRQFVQRIQQRQAAQRPGETRIPSPGSELINPLPNSLLPTEAQYRLLYQDEMVAELAYRGITNAPINGRDAQINNRTPRPQLIRILMEADQNGNTGHRHTAGYRWRTGDYTRGPRPR